MTIGEKIKDGRLRLGLTQSELGDKLGVKFSAVSKWERGAVWNIPISKVKMMAELFDCSPLYLLEGDDQSSPELLYEILETRTDLQQLLLLTYKLELSDVETLIKMAEFMGAKK